MEDYKEGSGLVPVEGEIVKDKPDELSAGFIPVETLKRLAKEADERVEAWGTIKKSVLRTTNQDDWINQSGKPYLQAWGAEKIANYLGIRWKKVGEERVALQDEENNYMYVVTLLFTWGGRTIEMVGSRSSRDDFFRVRYDGKGNKIRIPITEVDPGDILKSAIANALQRGITKMIGLNNLSWEDLAEYGITKDGMSKINYGKKPSKRGSRTSKASKQAPETPKPPEGAPQQEASSGIRGPVSDDEKRQAIMEMMYEEIGPDEMEAKRLLGNITAFKGEGGREVPGVTDVNALKGKRLDVTYHKMKDHHKKWLEMKKKLEEAEGGPSLPME